MTNPLRHMSLKIRVLCLVSLLIVAAIWGLAVVVATVLQRDLEKMVAQQLSVTLDYVADDIDQSVLNHFNELNKLAARITPQLQADPAKVQQVLEQSELAAAYFPEGIVCSDRRGIIFADRPVLPGRRGASLEDRAYFREIMAGARQAISHPLVGRFVQRPAVILAVPLKDAQGLPGGMLVGTLLLSDPDLFSHLEKLKLGKTGYFNVVSPKDRLIVSATDRKRILSTISPKGVRPLLDRRFEEGFEDMGVSVNSRGLEVLTLSRAIPSAGWIVVVAIETREAFAPISTLKREIYFGAMLISLLVAVFLYLVLKRQLAPLADAAMAMQRMSEGVEPLTTIPVKREDEIGQLVENFNRLVLERRGLDEDLRREVAERKMADDEIRNLAYHDALTRLPNRRLLFDRLQHAIAASSRSGRYCALLFIDLDNFKTLNDTLGHDAGDLLLQEVSRRLATCLREGDTAARLGGDEFVVLLENLSENAQEAATQAETTGEKIHGALNQTYQLANHEYNGTPSIGVTLFTDHQDTVDELVKRADLAMYHAKSAGRNALRFFDPQMQAVITTRATLEAGLREALLKQQFLLYYQAQVDSQGRVTGAEALLRWQHPQGELVSPMEFIPLAEDTGLILLVGRWVLETACAQLALWAACPELAHLMVAVNVSPREFHHKDFVEQVKSVLVTSGARPQRLKLELTESLLLHDVEDTIVKMTALRAEGVSFSLDDFGTGYSSLSYLKRLPLDQVKIDRSFVRDVLTDAYDSAIARSVIDLGRNLGLGVIAEGVESGAQRDFLAANGCQNYQGYLFSRPLPLHEFEKFVRRA